MKRRPDIRKQTVFMMLSVLLLGGWLLSVSPGQSIELQQEAEVSDRGAVKRDSADHLDQDFHRAVAMLRAGHHEDAITALERVIEAVPQMPEAQANMGYALLGQERSGPARDFFLASIALQPSQQNAYYGLALAEAKLGNRTAAAEAMRVFAHLASPDDPYLTKSHALLREWTAVEMTPAMGPASE